VIALARAQPGKLNYASVGTGSPGHIAGELFKLKAGIDIVHVPYKGGGPAVTDTIGGQVQMLFVSMPAVWQHVKSGRVRAIAVTSAKRSVSAPDVPTFIEAGVPDFVVDSWYGALVPAKTPPAAVGAAQRRDGQGPRMPQVKEKLLAQGAEAFPTTQAEFDKIIKDELAKWEYVIKAANIRPSRGRDGGDSRRDRRPSPRRVPMRRRSSPPAGPHRHLRAAARRRARPHSRRCGEPASSRATSCRTCCPTASARRRCSWARCTEATSPPR
jgi:hypothetical protein